MGGSQPAASGTLGTKPLVELLIYALDRSLDGSLELEESGGAKHAILLSDGAPAKVRTERHAVHLGEVLVEARVLTEEQRRTSFDAAEQAGRLHGEVLLELALVNEAELQSALREQITQKVLTLAQLAADTTFAYYPGVDLLGGLRGKPVRGRPLNLIWRALRANHEPAKADALLARLGERPLKFHARAPLRRFSFEPKERALVDVLRAKPQTLEELIACGVGSDRQVRRLVYALLVTRQFELGNSEQEPLGVREPRSQMPPPYTPPVEASRLPPRRSALPQAAGVASAAVATTSDVAPSPEIQELERELEQRGQALGGTHYEVLGVEQAAPAATIQAAFFLLAKRFHPDRLAPELAPRRTLATKVFARISEAHQVLADAERRRAYDQALRSDSDGEEERGQVQRALHAAACFQKAEVLLKRQNTKEALVAAQTAVDQDPSQPEYRALLAWIQAQDPGADLLLSLRVLDEAVEKEPANLRVRWYRGQLLKRSGEIDKAVRDFRVIVQAQPKHVDAAREVRLYEKRGGSMLDQLRDEKGTKTRSPEKTSKGETAATTLGRWFKRK